jgi:hypothetical protein
MNVVVEIAHGIFDPGTRWRGVGLQVDLYFIVRYVLEVEYSVLLVIFYKIVITLSFEFGMIIE